MPARAPTRPRPWRGGGGTPCGGGSSGAGALAGIGFTVSLFVVGLAFDDEPILQNEAKIGILGGAPNSSPVVVGSLILLRTRESHPFFDVCGHLRRRRRPGALTRSPEAVDGRKVKTADMTDCVLPVTGGNPLLLIALLGMLVTERGSRSCSAFATMGWVAGQLR